MDTGLGSPRSSSGYGSSEEDRYSSTGARRQRRRKSLAATGGTDRVSTPQTPQSLSPSDTGSSLSSPFSIDFRSVFDDVMPDFSDLTAFSETDDVRLPFDLMGTWNNEFEASDIRQPTKPNVVDGDRSSSLPKRGDKRLLRDDSHILVSLLKRPKAELDWIATGQQPSPDEFLNGNGSVCAGKEVTLDAHELASASPLQRLKALTNSDVVNDAARPPSTRTSAVVSACVSLPATVPVKVVGPPVSGLCYDGRTLVVQGQTSPQVLVPRSKTFLSSVAAVRRVAGTKTDCSYRRRSSPVVRVSAAPGAVRRVCSELDDHRYSTPIPPAITQRTWPPSSSLPSAKPPRFRRSSADGPCPPRRSSPKFRPTPSSSSSSTSSVLEILLRTSKQLRPNDGSDVTLTTCRETPPTKRPSSRRRVQSVIASNRADDPPASCTPTHGPLTSFVDTLDRDGIFLASDDGAAAATASSSFVGELLSTSSDSFSLFSEHLLCDSQGVIDIGLLTDDQQAWTPSRLDDKVMSSELEEIMQDQVRQDDTWLQQYLSDLL